MSKRIKKLILLPFFMFLILLFLLSGCSTETYVTSIKKTGANGAENIYTVTYSDGTTDTFTVTDGTDGKDLSITEIYEKYKKETGNSDLSYSDFLKQYLTVSNDTTARAINSCLQSSMKIYSEFVQTSSSISIWGQIYTTTDIAVSTGAAVVYQMDSAADGYSYIVTNYHVIYNNNADADKNGGTKIARKIYGYLYGSEGRPSAVDKDGDQQADKDSDGYTVYEYGNYAVALEYVGGSVISDLAVLRVKTSNLKAVNENVRAVTLADEYHVGETAIAIGNPEGNGLSVTQGIVSTENELISLNIDGTARSYRSLRIDTPLYSGNSGGGLFNSDGKLIGITNAGNQTDQNINYAVPLEVVTGTVDNILHYCNDGDAATSGVYKPTIGIKLHTQNSKYVYDSVSGFGTVKEDVILDTVEENSIAQKSGLQINDKIVAVMVNENKFPISRSFHIEDLLLTVRENDTIRFVVERNGVQKTTITYALSSADFLKQV